MEEATDLMSFVLLGAKFGLATLAAVGPLALFIIAASIGAEYLERKFQEKRDKED